MGLVTESGTGSRLSSYRGSEPEGQAMGQQVQGWRTARGQRQWLSMLIDTMEQISRPERRAVPCDPQCDPQVLAAFRAQLARPALGNSPYASAYSLRN